MYLTLFVDFLFGLCLWYALHFVLTSFHLDMEEIAECFAIIVFLMSCSCQCSVAFSHGASGWSTVCDCSISWSYSLSVL